MKSNQQNLKLISTPYYIYTTNSYSVHDINCGDTHISGNLNIGKQHNKIFNYDRLSNWDRKNVIVNLIDSTNLDLIIK